tara:strand:- start:228 stop:662 length:435 start_codon:yes stop_codon:yes gene_type:complete
MAASLDDILTTQRNGVIAINNLGQKLALIEADLPCVCTNLAIIAAASFPATTSATVAASTTTLITAGTGRVFSVSIPVHAGSAQVYIYDSATTGGISATNLIYASLPSNAASFTPYQNVNLAYTSGIVLKTDAGMNFCVAYTAN